MSILELSLDGWRDELRQQRTDKKSGPSDELIDIVDEYLQRVKSSNESFSPLKLWLDTDGAICTEWKGTTGNTTLQFREPKDAFEYGFYNIVRKMPLDGDCESRTLIPFPMFKARFIS